MAYSTPTLLELIFSGKPYKNNILRKIFLQMLRALFSAFVKTDPAPEQAQLSPRPGTPAYHLKRIGKGTFTQRLENIGYDTDLVPRLLCDSICFTPMDDPCMVDFVRDHAMDQKTIETSNYINPHNKQPITAIPSEIDNLEREIEGIKRQPFYARFKLEKEEYIRLSDLKDALKYSIEHGINSEDKKNRLISQLKDIESKLQALEGGIKHKEIPVKQTMNQLSRLEQQVLLLNQRDEFITILEGIYCLQLEIKKIIAKPAAEFKSLQTTGDLIDVAFQTILHNQIIEIEKCKAVILAKKSLLFELDRFIRLTENIIESEKKDEGEQDNSATIKGKTLEKVQILTCQQELVRDISEKIDEWNLLQQRLQQHHDNKVEAIALLTKLARENEKPETSFGTVIANCHDLQTQAGLAADAINKLIKNKLIKIFTYALEKMHSEQADEKALRQLFSIEINQWITENQTQAYINSRKKDLAASLATIARLQNEIYITRSTLIKSASVVLNESGLTEREIQFIITDQLPDIEKSEAIVNAKFALLTELEVYMNIARDLKEEPGAEQIELTKKIYTDLQFLVGEDENKQNQQSSSRHVLMPFKLHFDNLRKKSIVPISLFYNPMIAINFGTTHNSMNQIAIKPPTLLIEHFPKNDDESISKCSPNAAL